MNEFAYPDCILGRLYVPGSDEDEVVCYSKKRLIARLIKDGLQEEDVNDYISFNVIYSPKTALLNDDA